MGLSVFFPQDVWLFQRHWVVFEFESRGLLWSAIGWPGRGLEALWLFFAKRLWSSVSVAALGTSRYTPAAFIPLNSHFPDPHTHDWPPTLWRPTVFPETLKWPWLTLSESVWLPKADDTPDWFSSLTFTLGHRNTFIKILDFSGEMGKGEEMVDKTSRSLLEWNVNLFFILLLAFLC